MYVEDSFVIGAVTLTKNDDKLHLSDLVVDEKYRRKGIGTSLVRESINYAEENNFDEITLNVREENDAAINLYDNEEFMVKEDNDYVQISNSRKTIRGTVHCKGHWCHK